jgi:hypothetical protein
METGWRRGMLEEIVSSKCHRPQIWFGLAFHCKNNSPNSSVKFVGIQCQRVTRVGVILGNKHTCHLARELVETEPESLVGPDRYQMVAEVMVSNKYKISRNCQKRQ